jgi:hypothetical protein
LQAAIVKMKHIVKGLLWFFAGALLLISLALAIAYWQKDTLINYVLGEVNQNVKTKINVASIDLSLVKHFPNTAIALNQVYAAPAKPFAQNDTLLAAKRIYLLFDFWQLLNSKYHLKKVVIEDAMVKLLIDKNGFENFDIWKSSGSKTATKLNLNLNQVLLKRTAFIFENNVQQNKYDTYINYATLKGNFTDTQFEVSANADLALHQLNAVGLRLSQTRHTKLNCNYKVDKTKNAVTFLPSQIVLQGFDLSIAGSIVFLKDSTKYDMVLTGKQIDLIMLSTVWPAVANITKKYEAKGQVNFNATIKGFQTQKQLPKIAADFNTTNASLITPNGAVLNQITFKGLYNNSFQNNDLLSIEPFNASLNGLPVAGAITIKNLKDPAVKISINGKFDLNKLSSFYKPDTIESISGMAALDVFFEGKISTPTSYLSNGNIKLSAVDLVFKNSPTKITGFNASVFLADNDLQVQLLEGMVGSSDFKFTGNIDNAFSYFLNQQDALHLDAILKSKTINLNDIVFTNSNGSSGVHFSDKINCTLNVSIGNLSYNKFEGRNLLGTVTLSEGILSADALKMQTLDGSIKANGMIDANSDRLRIACNADFDNINATKAFVAFSNFGQNAIAADNINGFVTATLQINSIWSRQLVLDKNSLYANCKIRIVNGALLNFEPMLALSRFVKSTDLQRVTFDTLFNNIEIKNNTIHIPLMNISSSALKLKASGSHNFSNDVDYHIQIALSQLLRKKALSNQTEFGTIEDDGLGNTQLFLKMTGNLKSPKFAYDKQAVKQHLSTQVKTERQNIKSVLNKEFGWFKKDSINTKNHTPQKQKEAVQIDYDE